MMNTKLIVALDLPTSKDIPETVSNLPQEISWYKVGLELFTSEGPSSLSYLKEEKKNIFLDLKLHDIPRTVANAVKTSARYGVKMMTVHACGGRGMLEAAAEAAASLGDDAPLLVAVTTLTSLDQNDLTDIGITRPLSEQTISLGELAISSGIDGLVCSPLEVEDFRKVIGNEPVIVTPGIRPTGSDVADQKRITTPSMAVESGSSFLVVGRPIMQADDPSAAARGILNEIQSACS